MTTGDDTPLYKFKDNVGYVVSKGEDGLKIIEVGRSHFVLCGTGIHPDSLQPTYLGEIASGRWDGAYWFLEPGWFEKLDQWAELCS